MNSIHIIWPVLSQIFLTLTIFILLGVWKFRAVKAGEVNRQQSALNNRVWPQDVVKISNNIANQFEIPVLFYVLCLVLYSNNNVDIVAIVLAWMFVLSRFAHAYVHLGSNYVQVRFRLFLVMIVMLMLVAWKLAAAGAVAV